MNDGAPPGPDPKAIRPSMVDSGWSAPPPRIAEPELPPPPGSDRERAPQPSARPLPSYEAHEAGVRDVTMVDREIQTRAKAMREKDTLPPPRRASAFPPAPPPPPPPARSQEPPVVIRNPDALASPLPGASRPPPPSRPRQSVPPAPPSRPSAPPARPSLPPALPAVAAADDLQGVSAARNAATLVRPRSSQNPQPLPSFGAALGQRVRFAGGEVPLWSLVTPLVLLVALGTAFAAAAVTAAADPSAAQPALKASAEPSASVAQLPAPLPPAPTPSLTASADDKPKPLTLLERVALGDDAAVKELSAKPVADLRVEEAISLSLGQSAQDLRAARALRDRVDHDPGLIKDADVLTQLRHYADDPETSRDALSAMANVPGPISADLIYEVWTATASRTTATDLARSLIYSKEVRAKASPALAIALDLRDAETCEKNRDLLGRVTADGDRRAFHLLGKLTRKYGCGANKRADCYACLRSGTDLDAAMKAVKARREPHPFGN